MADRSNYADRPSAERVFLKEHTLAMGNEARAYTPSDGDADSDGHSTLVPRSTGDWSWRPHFHYCADPGISYSGDPRPESLERRLELELQMPTYRASKHPYYDGPVDGAPGADEFQQRARAAHRDAGDYRRHPADMRL